MEKIGVVEEKNNQTSSAVIPVFKTVKPHVKIDSISINLGMAMNKSFTENCQHFSIRGYVAEMRNKNVRVCAPFARDGDDETKLREQLPPLDVVKFRRWCCQSCVQEISVAGPSESQQNTENTSPNLVRGENHPSACIYKEKSNSLGRLPVVCGQESGSKDVSDQEIGDQTLRIGNCLSCPIEERHIDGTAGTKSMDKELADVSVPKPGNGEAASDVLAIEYPGYRCSSSHEADLAEKANYMDEEPKKSLTSNEDLGNDPGTSVMDMTEINNKDLEDGAGTSAFKDVRVNKHPSNELQERNNGLEKCNQAPTESNHQVKQHESTAPRRKKKVRLIADILNVNGKEKCDQMASCNETPNAIASLASTSSQRKRKMYRGPSREMQLPNSEAKKIRHSKGDAKTTMATIDISESESEEDATGGTGLRSYTPLQQTESRSCSSKMKNKVFHGEGSQGLCIPQKSLGKESFEEEMGLDLSLNSYMNNNLVPKETIMPINDHWRKDGMSIGESPAPEVFFSKDAAVDISGRIVHGTVTMHQPDNSLALHKKLDLSLRCNKKATEPERLPEVSRKNTDQRSDMAFEQRNYDDIPMDIVELMAKHQYERGLSDAERNSCLTKRIDNRNYEMMGFADVHGNRARPLQNEQNKWNSSHANGNHFVVGDRDNIHVLPVFGTWAQTRPKESFGTQASASRSFNNTDTHNPLRSGDMFVQRSSPSNIQLFDTYNTTHNGVKQSGTTGNTWTSCASSMMPPPALSLPQKIASQTSDIDTQSRREDLHKGKTVLDLDLNRADPNDPDIDMFTEYPLVSSDMRRDMTLTGVDSVHQFSSEALPAMQLLSLMDAGMESRASFSLDARKELEKPLFSCDNRPDTSLDRRQDLFERPLFPQSNQVKEFSGSGPAMYKSSGNTRLTSSAYGGPKFVTSQEVKIPNCNPRQNKHKENLGAYANMVCPLQPDTLQNSKNRVDGGTCHMHGTIISPMKDTSKGEVCVVNRNPADFTIPESGGAYMIRGQDLKFDNDMSRSKIGGFAEQRRRGLTKFTTPDLLAASAEQQLQMSIDSASFFMGSTTIQYK